VRLSLFSICGISNAIASLFKPMYIVHNLIAMELFMSTPELSDHLYLDNQFCFPLYRATNAMVRAYRSVLEPLDLTYAQYLTMLVLWQTEGVSVKELGDRLHLDSGTLTPLLKRLEVKQLIVRGRCSKDERVRVISTTDIGKELKSKAALVPEQMRCKLGELDIDLLGFKAMCQEVYLALEKNV